MNAAHSPPQSCNSCLSARPPTPHRGPQLSQNLTRGSLPPPPLPRSTLAVPVCIRTRGSRHPSLWPRASCLHKPRIQNPSREPTSILLRVFGLASAPGLSPVRRLRRRRRWLLRAASPMLPFTIARSSAVPSLVFKVTLRVPRQAGGQEGRRAPAPLGRARAAVSQLGIHWPTANH